MKDDPSDSEAEIERLIAAGEKLFRKARKISEKYEDIRNDNRPPLKEEVEPATNEEQAS
jgi:hypothetical protein